MLPKGFKLEFRVWERALMHDRYLLTDCGGIDLGIGFDESSQNNPEEVKMSRLSNEARKKEWNDYNNREEAKNYFVLVGE